MANILQLAMKITADSSEFQRSLSPIERSLQTLGKESAKVASLFDTFAKSSTAAASAQTEVQNKLDALTAELQDGRLAAEDYDRQFSEIKNSAKDLADEFKRGAELTNKYRTEADKQAETLAELNRLKAAGAIDEKTYAAAAEEATGAAAERAAAEKRASEIISQVGTAQERAAQQVAAAEQTRSRATAELNSLRNAGLLTEQQYAAALDRVEQQYNEAAAAAGRLGNETDAAASAGTLKFNELSGVLGLIPGPLGGIAARMSSLASASEGLGKVLQNPTAAISGLTSSMTSFLTPANLAVAGLAAFGAGATAIYGALRGLDDRVEMLGNKAAQLGVSFESIQILEESAKRSGTSIEAVATAFGRLQKSVTGVDEESKQAQKALANIGVTAEQLQELAPEEQYRLLADRITAIEDPAKRTATAIALFGKTGNDLIPFFNNLGLAAEDVERFGGALSDLDRRRIDQFGDSFDEVARAATRLGEVIALPFAGLAEGANRGFAELTAGITAIVKPIGDVLEPLLTNIGRAVELLGVGLGNIGRLIGAVLTPLGDAVQFIGQVLEPINEAFVDLIRYISDGTVRVAEWLQSFSPIYAITDAFGGAAEAAEAVSSVVSRVTRIVSAAVSQFAKFFQDTIGRVLERIGAVVSGFTEWLGLGDAFDTFGGFFTGLWDTIKAVVAGIGGFIDRVLQFAEDWLGIKAVAEEPVEIEIDDGGRLEEILAENKEFQKVLDGITQSVSDAIDESAEFGEAGFDAALKYQESVKDLQEQLDRGLINEAVFEAEARKAGELFKREIDRIEEDAQLEIQIKENAEKAVARVREELSKAIDESAQFGKAGFDAAIEYQNAVESLQEQFENGIINENTLQKEAEKANKIYEERIKTLEDARKEQEKLIEDDRKRVDEMLAKDNELAKAEEDILAVRREQARVAAELARGDASAADADSLRRRASELEKLEADLQSTQQALEQGFTEGFSKAFDEVRKGLEDSQQKAEQFGDAGARAAGRLRDGIAQAQQLVRDGVLNKEAFDAEVRNQQELFDKRLKFAGELEEFFKSQLTDRQRLELEFIEKQKAAREEAIKRITLLEEELADKKKQIEEARERGDLKEAANLVAQRDQLQGVLRQQEQFVREAGNAANQGLQQQQQQVSRLQEIQSQTQAGFQQSVQDTIGAVNSALEAQGDALRKQAARLREIFTLGPRTLNAADVRTAEGAALVQQLASEQIDPNLAEARRQTKLLQQMAGGIASAAANYFDSPVAIVGGARLG